MSRKSWLATHLLEYDNPAEGKIASWQILWRSQEVISNPPFIVLYSSICSLQERSLRTLRFNHSNATGIDMSFVLPTSEGVANPDLI
jgi:hypothetical protein